MHCLQHHVYTPERIQYVEAVLQTEWSETDCSEILQLSPSDHLRLTVGYWTKWRFSLQSTGAVYIYCHKMAERSWEWVFLEQFCQPHIFRVGWWKVCERLAPCVMKAEVGVSARVSTHPPRSSLMSLTLDRHSSHSREKGYLVSSDI